MGQAPTWAELEPHMPGLERYARTLTRGTPLEAEDLVQDTLVRALSKWHLFDGTNLKAWMGTLLHNQFVNKVRASVRAGTEVPIEGAFDLASAGVSTGLDKLMLDDVRRALGRLPEEQRQALMLVGVEGMRYEEAADVLDVPIGTVRSRLSRGRVALREAVEA